MKKETGSSELVITVEWPRRHEGPVENVPGAYDCKIKVIEGKLNSSCRGVWILYISQKEMMPPTLLWL